MLSSGSWYKIHHDPCIKREYAHQLHKNPAETRSTLVTPASMLKVLLLLQLWDSFKLAMIMEKCPGFAASFSNSLGINDDSNCTRTITARRTRTHKHLFWILCNQLRSPSETKVQNVRVSKETLCTTRNALFDKYGSATFTLKLCPTWSHLFWSYISTSPSLLFYSVCGYRTIHGVNDTRSSSTLTFTTILSVDYDVFAPNSWTDLLQFRVSQDSLSKSIFYFSEFI